jgi:VanZ family protein
MKMPIEPRVDAASDIAGHYPTPWATMLLRPRLWVFVWCALAVITSVLYLLPNAGPPGRHQLDKIVHLVAFGSIGFSSMLASSRFRLSVPLSVTLALAMILEWLQSYVPGREYSMLDWTANLVGVGLGIVAALAFRALAARALDHAA